MSELDMQIPTFKKSKILKLRSFGGALPQITVLKIQLKVWSGVDFCRFDFVLGLR
jgi:hypothetical protein